MHPISTIDIHSDLMFARAGRKIKNLMVVKVIYLLLTAGATYFLFIALLCSAECVHMHNEILK
jgi:hypothetical protein